MVAPVSGSGDYYGYRGRAHNTAHLGLLSIHAPSRCSNNGNLIGRQRYGLTIHRNILGKS